MDPFAASPIGQCQYSFYPLQSLKFPGLSQKSTIESLKKWGIHDGLRLQGYSFDTPSYRPYLQRVFVQDFFSDPNVYSSFVGVTSTAGRGGHSKLTPAPVCGHADINPKHLPSISIREVACTATSLTLFDKLLADRSVVYEGAAGEIRQCPEITFTPAATNSSPSASRESGTTILVQNELTKAIIRARGDGHLLLEGDDGEDEECDDHEGANAPRYDYRQEYSEFLFRLFGHLVLGGDLCQCEETVRSYMDVAKTIYKDLISVSMCESDAVGTLGAGDSSKSTELAVDSVVLQIDAEFLFSKPHYNNFLYLIIDTRKNICYSMYNQIVA